MSKTAIISDTYTSANTKSKGWLNIIIMVVVIIAIVMIAKAIYTASKAGGLALGSELGKQIVELQTGIPAARQSVCEDVAKKCRENLSVWWGTTTVFSISAEPIIQNLNRLVSSNEAALTGSYFTQKNGFSLKDKLTPESILGLTEKHKNQIKPDIWNGLI